MSFYFYNLKFVLSFGLLSLPFLFYRCISLDLSVIDLASDGGSFTEIQPPDEAHAALSLEGTFREQGIVRNYLFYFPVAVT
jgi:hypothetical protein